MAESEADWFYLDAELHPGDRLELGAEETRHARRSLRLGDGDRLLVTNGRGCRGLARLLGGGSSAGAIEIEAVSTVAAERPALWVASGIVRGPRFDFLIEKAAELGAAGVAPLVCRHSEVRPRAGGEKPERWRRLMVAAVKQSHRAWLPALLDPLTPGELLERFPRARWWIGHPGLPESAGGQSLAPQYDKEVTSPSLEGEVIILCTGPEGGWAEEELGRFAQAGARFVDLGNGRLRAETAAIALLTAAKVAFGGVWWRTTP